MAAEDSVEVEDQGGDGERERSTIAFPYADLDNATRVAKAVHQVGGTACQLAQLGAQLDVKITGGGFRLMLAAARVFGLITITQGNVQLTVLGQRINDPTQEKTAKAEAFLTVALYRAIYDRVKGAGGTLPPNAGLENEMVSLGVSKKVVDRARQVFQRSASQAGFFAFGQDRLILPVTGPGGSEQRKPHEKPDDATRKKHGGADDDGGGRHPFIAGLLKELPAEGAEWTTEERRKWLQAAAMIFDLIYKNGGSGKALKIEVESAK
jgi:hypothetical protein